MTHKDWLRTTKCLYLITLDKLVLTKRIFVRREGCHAVALHSLTYYDLKYSNYTTHNRCYRYLNRGLVSNYVFVMRNLNIKLININFLRSTDVIVRCA